MCGIAGFLSYSPSDKKSRWSTVLDRMGDSLAHRGPDGAGTWLDMSAGIGLSHRRLSIIDVSEGGRQPMHSASGRYVISFNGEIYNFPTLRAELEATGVRFRGGSDTEVLLAAVDRWGIRAALPRFEGMFAFAIWDREERSLSLARDRLGKKPLYVATHGRTLLFGSELKALMAFPGYAPHISRTALGLYLRYSYVPEPHCIYADAAKVPPGTFWTVPAERLGSLSIERMPAEAVPYWSLKAIAEQPRDPAMANPDVAADSIHDALSVAVSERMIADVPLGAFLSGGIDSSLVVALMQRQATSRLKTFTIGFEEQAYDEADHAQSVAAALGTDHTALYAAPGEALSLIDRLPDVYDEPFADPSQLPTMLVSQLARRHITVALTGDGGDETFCGYDIYQRALSLQGLYRVPHRIRSWAGGSLAAVPEAAWDRGVALAGRVAPRMLSGSRIHGAAELMTLPDFAAVHRRDMIRWAIPPLRGGLGVDALHGPDARWGDLRAAEDLERMMYVDTLGYLPGDILVKVDRASMASGLEVRSPLLDHRVIEAAWRLPVASKMRSGVGKLVLRSILARYLPQPLFERPKQGFGVPVAAWLRGPLREWAEDLLGEREQKNESVLDMEIVRRTWAEHLSGTRDHGFRLWTVLMLQAWLRRWRPGDVR
jgi:asparagine synthase (glutamine-hydrolysing)